MNAHRRPTPESRENLEWFFWGLGYVLLVFAFFAATTGHDAPTAPRSTGWSVSTDQAPDGIGVRRS